MSLSQSEQIRRQSGNGLLHWLNLSGRRLEEQFAKAKTLEDQLKVIEAGGKLAERYGKYAGLEKEVVVQKGNRKTIVEVVRKDTGLGEY